MLILLQSWFPVLLWAVVIALLSRSDFQPGFTYRWLQAVAEFFSLGLSASTLFHVNAVLRKVAHLTEYFVLALLVWRALRRGAAAWWRWSWVGATLAVTTLWAAIDEFHQRFERGRHGSLTDVGYDVVGVGLALLFLYAWGRRTRCEVAGGGPGGD